VIAGSNHTFQKGTVDGQDKLYACGQNKYGQLGLGHTERVNQWTEVTMPKDFMIEQVIAEGQCNFLKGKDKLYACGWNCEGQLGLGDRRNRN
jgi:alpha-tubulin suppressor-like RCC1 family protein